MRKNYLEFFKFYQPKATGGGFLIFEWTLCSAPKEVFTSKIFTKYPDNW
jgi:hypothetical protein